MLYQIFQHYRENDFAKGLKLYDVFTVLYLLDPESYETILASVRIELHGTLTKGATVVDYDSHYPNCKIVTSSINKNYCSIFKVKSYNKMHFITFRYSSLYLVS